MTATVTPINAAAAVKTEMLSGDKLEAFRAKLGTAITKSKEHKNWSDAQRKFACAYIKALTMGGETPGVKADPEVIRVVQFRFALTVQMQRKIMAGHILPCMGTNWYKGAQAAAAKKAAAIIHANRQRQQAVKVS